MMAQHEIRHIPVLLQKVLRIMDPRPGQVIVDCTLGLGGHAVELLRRVTPGGSLIGIDFDPRNIELARPMLTGVGGQFSIHHGNFAGLHQILAESGVAGVDGILADLGVASPQIDDRMRGFSYRLDGPLDMRMDPTRGQPASALIAQMSVAELRDAILELGDETDAPEIARLIVDRRRQRPIRTTHQLMAIICEARHFTLQRAAGAKLHPAARTFQALRILTNREMGNLENLLRILPGCLKPGGVAVIISFHSGEDRRVKESFKEGFRSGVYCDISDDPIKASEDEAMDNPRSRSAKLRWARRATQRT